MGATTSEGPLTRGARISATPAKARARLITILGMVVIILVNLAALALVLNLQHRAMEGRRRGLVNLVTVLSAEVERSFQGVRAAQADIADRTLRRGGETREGFDKTAAAENTFNQLQNKRDELAYVDAMSIVGRNGALLNFSRSWQAPWLDVAGSEYFQALAADRAATDYLTVPVRNPSSGNWTLYLAHKVRDDAGEMLGLVVADMRLDDFANFYGRIRAAPGATVALYRQDGTLLAGFPVKTEWIGKRLVSLTRGPGPLPVARDGDAVEVVDMIDQRPHLIAAAAQKGFPPFITVSVPMAVLAAEWRNDALAIGGGAVLLTLLLVACMVLGRRHVHAQQEASRAAYDMARHDVLTGLPNRLMFTEALRVRLGGGRAGQQAGAAVLLLNLDSFKRVNDGLGHSVGDQVLAMIAGRLRGLVDGTHLLCRLSGDEFAVLQQPSDRADAEALATRIVGAVDQPWYTRNYRIVVGISVGIAFYPSQGRDGEQLLKNADMALLRAKAEGRGRWRIFEPAMAQDQEHRRAAEAALRDALDNDGFEVYFQPLVDTVDSRLRGFEALLRWRSPRPGRMAAPQVISVAEETGLIVPLGRWVLETACAQAARWPGDVRVAVNVSAWQFRSGELMNQVRHALDAAGLPPHRLELEITETVLLQNTEEVRSILDQLRALGVSISLDDFGTGYSSLLYLRRFPADRIKIDMAFVSDICTNAESARIVGAIIGLGHSLNMETTGEGVETREQWDQLRRAGCTEIQGYYVGRPAPASESYRYLEQYGGAAAPPVATPGEA